MFDYKRVFLFFCLSVTTSVVLLSLFLQVNPALCDSCGRCVSVCETGALQTNTDGQMHIDYALCTQCGLCLVECPHSAITDLDNSGIIWGTVYSEYNFPLRNAIVSVDSFVHQTDFSGKFSFELLTGTYQLSCSASSYQNIQVELVLSAYEVIRQDIFMQTAESANDQSLSQKFIIYPSPFKLQAGRQQQISWYSNERSVCVELEIFNLKGKRVIKLMSNSSEFFWDGKDDSNDYVASGVYLYKLSGRNIIQKSIVIR